MLHFKSYFVVSYNFKGCAANGVHCQRCKALRFPCLLAGLLSYEPLCITSLLHHAYFFILLQTRGLISSVGLLSFGCSMLCHILMFNFFFGLSLYLAVMSGCLRKNL